MENGDAKQIVEALAALLEQHVSRLEARIDRLEVRMDEKFARLDRKIEGVALALLSAPEREALDAEAASVPAGRTSSAPISSNAPAHP